MTQQHRITIEKHCALSLYSLIFFLTLFFSVPLYAQTELPAAPNWSTTNTTQSSDGVYTLRWAPVVDADFYQISEIGPKGTHDWFTFREFESFVKNEPGNYRYALRSCRGVAESPVECGFPGQSIQVTVAADVRAHHEQMPSNDELAVQNIVGATIHCPARTEQPGGPDILIPGAWHTECQPGHGWAFYWVNALRFPEGSELHRNVYELLGVWTTYRYMGGSYKPVWLYMPMRAKSDLLYDGPILYQTLAQNNHCAQGELIIGTPNKCQITAGHIRVLFRNSDNNSEADVEWHLNMPGFPVVRSITQPITPLISTVEGTAVADNHLNFQSGWWWSRPNGRLDESFAYMVQIFKDIEFDHLIFYDDDGHPIWMSANKNVDPANSSVETFTDNQLRYVETGYAPGVFADPPSFTRLESGQLSRQFDPIREGHTRTGDFSANVLIDVDGRDASLNRNVDITKVVNFYDVDYIISGQPNGSTVCTVPAGQECVLDVQWFRDDHFPQARIELRNLSDNSSSVRFSDIAQVNTNEQLSLPEGQYRFEMYRDAGSTAPLLAKSRVLQVLSAGPAVETPPTPFANPNLSAPPSSSRVGATTGQFNVNTSGAATYSIPVLVTPGSGGLQPNVSLNYNSQSGNGLAGLGWNLSAYSLISRCAQTYEQDAEANNLNFIPTGVQLNEQDRFCLDGERLMLIEGSAYGANGAVYRKELDDFIKVTSSGNTGDGPRCFIAEMPDGGVAHYGQCAESANSSALNLE